VKEASPSTIIQVAPSYDADVILPRGTRPPPVRPPLVFIGASTGGTEALKIVLSALSPDCPPILVAQHMPPNFTRSFAARLDGLCRIRVKEAEHNEPLQRGCAYIAPGDAHLMAGWRANWMAVLDRGSEVNRHKPSVDVLFRSAANESGSAALGVILTGMGRDGARGLLEMKQAGAYTLAQDEASSVVFGMPKEAIALGAAYEVLPLDRIGGRIMECLARRPAPGGK